MEMRICKVCNEEKEINLFPLFTKRKSYKCKICYNLYYKKYFSILRNKRNHVGCVTTVNKRQMKENRIKFLHFLLKNPCINCGEKNPLVLEMDHRIASEKTFNLCEGLASKSYIRWELIEEEIKKCDVLCANCHRIKSANDSNYWKISLLKELELENVKN